MNSIVTSLRVVYVVLMTFKNDFWGSIFFQAIANEV